MILCNRKFRRKPAGKPKRRNEVLFGKGKIAVRSRNINIALFALALVFMIMALFAGLNRIIEQVAVDYVARYATSCADALSARISKEVSLMANAAGSGAVIDWLNDEDNDEKKLFVFREMAGILGELYSDNLYIGVEKSRREYSVSSDYTNDIIRHFTVLDSGNPADSWYFDCIYSDSDYTLNIGIDAELDRKRVWLNYKITQNGTILGVLCTGLGFTYIAGELFSQYDDNNIRGLIVDKNGIIYMDSSMLYDDAYLHYTFESKIEDKFSDPVLHTALQAHFDDTAGDIEQESRPVTIKLQGREYGYMAIAPIDYTDWSAVILYDASSLLGISMFLPVIIAMLLLLIIFAIATSAVGYRLIFMPLAKLDHSLAQLNENSKERIYGVERDDELGTLANTIQDLFTKANYDALTGIYNRRFMEKNIQRAMEFLSRSDDLLSVLMIDIDCFKFYNDTYGHDRGDVCLRAVAQTLAGRASRVNDFAARYGGEEFIAVLPYTDKEGACGIAAKMLEDIRGMNLPHAKNVAADSVTVSIGVTSGKVGHLHHWEAYVKHADEALYTSKQTGRNRYTYIEFTESNE